MRTRASGTAQSTPSCFEPVVPGSCAHDIATLACLQRCVSFTVERPSDRAQPAGISHRTAWRRHATWFEHVNDPLKSHKRACNLPPKKRQRQQQRFCPRSDTDTGSERPVMARVPRAAFAAHPKRPHFCKKHISSSHRMQEKQSGLALVLLIAAI